MRCLVHGLRVNAQEWCWKSSPLGWARSVMTWDLENYKNCINCDGPWFLPKGPTSNSAYQSFAPDLPLGGGPNVNF